MYAIGQRMFLGTRALLPVRTYLSLTNKCNCSCYFCGYAANSCKDEFTQDPYKDELSFDHVKPIVDWLPKGSVITFSGGEPTLAKDFFKIVEYAAKDHKVQIPTNGVTLNKEKVRKLIDSGVWIINLSIDSHKKELHDKIRGHDGLSQRIIETIKEIKQVKQEKGSLRPYIHVNTIVLKETIPDLPEMVKQAVINNQIRKDCERDITGG